MDDDTQDQDDDLLVGGTVHAKGMALALSYAYITGNAEVPPKIPDQVADELPGPAFLEFRFPGGYENGEKFGLKVSHANGDGWMPVTDRIDEAIEHSKLPPRDVFRAGVVSGTASIDVRVTDGSPADRRAVATQIILDGTHWTIDHVPEPETPLPVLRKTQGLQVFSETVRRYRNVVNWMHMVEVQIGELFDRSMAL